MIKAVAYVLIFMLIFLGVTLHEQDIKHDNERNIYNYTREVFIWNSSSYPIIEINSTDVNMEGLYTIRVTNIIRKMIDFIGFSFFEGSKAFLEFGYEKMYKYSISEFIPVMKLILVIALISLFVPLIVPILALIYLLFEGFRWVIERFKK